MQYAIFAYGYPVLMKKSCLFSEEFQCLYSRANQMNQS